MSQEPVPIQGLWVRRGRRRVPRRQEGAAGHEIETVEVLVEISGEWRLVHTEDASEVVVTASPLMLYGGQVFEPDEVRCSALDPLCYRGREMELEVSRVR